MKLFVLALFVALATAAPLDDGSGPVELIVNGVPDGHALELGDVLDIKLKEHADGEVIATDLLYPLTAVGIAEAAAANIGKMSGDEVLPEVLEPVLPEAVMLPTPAQPEVILPEPVVLPLPEQPEVVIPEAVVLPAPAQPEVVLPESVVLLPPAVPEVVIEPIPVPAAQLPNGEVYNDGTVQVTVNTPDDGVISTVKGWLSMVLNFISNGTVQSTQQII